jgi:hypothetical protein
VQLDPIWCDACLAVFSVEERDAGNSGKYRRCAFRAFALFDGTAGVEHLHAMAERRPAGGLVG